MTHKAYRSCLLLIIYFLGQTMSLCQGPYINMCGYYDNEFNTTEIEDSFKTICDCQQVRFCFLVEILQECNSTIVKLNTVGSFTFSNHMYCNISFLESDMKTAAHEFLNHTENEIIINILTDSDFGKYKISCSDFETFDEFNATVNDEWEIVSVDPTEVTIDSEVTLQLTVVPVNVISQFVWCFVKTPDNTTEILSSLWMSEIQINCSGFKPVIPGIFRVSLSSVTPIFDKGINVNVSSRHPIAEQAEYSLDLTTICIYFDENVELHSSCVKLFSKESLKNFGTDFDCFTRGNILVVRMGSHFQFVDNISLTAENKICRAGSTRPEFCFSASPVNLVVPKPKVLGPILSVYRNPGCESSSSQKYMNVKVISPKFSSSATQNQTLQTKSSGKTQRKNLIMWRLMRKIENKFSSHLNISQINETEVLPLLENLSSFDNAENVGEYSLESASVSIYIQSTPGITSIVAEATVTFCETIKLYWHKWIVNGEDVFEKGKLLVMKNLTPGKYLIKCLVVTNNSNEILGQGWTTTEILPSKQKVIVTPSEITAGTDDNISFYAVTWPGNSLSWTCRTAFNKLCFTTDQKSASNVLDMTSPNISLPAGTFPVGHYIWTVENAQGANRADVFIKSGNRPAVGVEISSPFVEPSEEFVLRGFVRKAQPNCCAWWSSVRQKGFSYLNLDDMMETKEILMKKKFPVDEINLVIPPPSENWKGLETNSMYMFKLQVFCPHSSNNQNGSFDYVKVSFSVNNPPRASPLSVEPSGGIAMITNFMVSGGLVDVSGSMVFEWSYVDSCDAEVLIKRGAFARNFTTYLPPGDVKVKLKICNEREICSTTSTSTINVIQDSEFPRENFQNARNQIQFLMNSGETFEAFGLAITVFKSLALLPETGLREMIFSTIEEGIKTRIKDLTKRLQSDVKCAKLAMEFFERAVMVAKYFRKNSDILIKLMEFKDRILRNTNSGKMN